MAEQLPDDLREFFNNPHGVSPEVQERLGFFRSSRWSPEEDDCPIERELAELERIAAALRCTRKVEDETH
jgi:hypothetical protein